jgi:hypothetical protein
MKGEVFMQRHRRNLTGFVLMIGLTLLAPAAEGGQEPSPGGATSVNPVLEWNQIFVEMLIATNTANSSSPRLGAIVHSAIFDAYNGIEQRYSPIFVRRKPPGDALPQAAVVAAAYTSLMDLFPSQKSALDSRYAASLEALNTTCEGTGQSPISRPSCARSIARGLEWGFDVASIILGWRATDGFAASYPPFMCACPLG